MSTRSITYRQCNGCGKDEMNDSVEIVQSKAVQRYADVPVISLLPAETVDLCYGCKEEGKFICRFCREVHSSKAECPTQLLIQAARERRAQPA